MPNIHNGTPLKRLLAMRFSAMGDAAMTVPVLYALATQHPELRITMLTRTRFVPLFEWLPANVQVKGVDFAEQDGIIGLTKMYNQLREGDFDAVADLHNVLRSKYLRTCFLLAGTKVAVVDKGRKEKKELLGQGREHAALRPMTERYADVFRALGLSIDLSQPMQLDLRQESFTSIRSLVGWKAPNDKWIGIAPFAAHESKIYPLERMHSVADLLAEKGYTILLFGAGTKEAGILKTWERNDGEKGHILSICGKLQGLKQELMLMSLLDLMISMDSANMHMAAMLGKKVLSIWGATHPKAGFSGYGQTRDSEVQIGDLPCRPCSIYGKKPCAWGDLRCMNIAPEIVVEKVLNMIKP